MGGWCGAMCRADGDGRICPRDNVNHNSEAGLSHLIRRSDMFAAQVIDYSNATQPSATAYEQMMDDDTCAKAMRLDWDDFKLCDTRVLY